MRVGKCEVFSAECINYDKELRQPKYPKRRRVPVPLYPLRFESGSAIMMCSDCRNERLKLYPELGEWQRRHVHAPDPVEETNDSEST